MKNLLADFQNPGAEYRGAPFWAWNGKLDPETLRHQIRLMNDAGIGGFFMHSRVGLDTPYLSKEWFDCIDACVDEAKKRNMRAWLYDEDRWPSGAAGGIVTKNPKFRVHRLYALVCEGGVVPGGAFLPGLPDGSTLDASVWKAVQPVAVFTAALDGGRASRVRRVAKGKAPVCADGEAVLVFAVRIDEDNSWYNGGAYLDTLNPEATAAFIRTTHEAYLRNNGGEFGRAIPGVFTDEPNHGSPLWSAPPAGEGLPSPCHILAWTGRLPARFKKAKGYDLVPRLPGLIFDIEGSQATQLRYDYNDVITDLFVQGFTRQIGDWCGAHNLQFTGHLLEEDSLACQTHTVGSCMRSYEYMQAPGMDMLTENWRIFSVAKQVSSVAHQFGRRTRLSETYGCTGWDFPFSGHKALGDWQAALGINLRCMHLAWYTMLGQAKRDYPASIFHQSPWWPFYRKIEDYFARINAVMTRGEEVRDILFLHPVESVWTQTGLGWERKPAVCKLDDDFLHLTDLLLANHLDFDYGDEDIMARHAKIRKGKDGTPAVVIGHGVYRAVVVPSALTLRSTTLSLLRRFRKAGGTVVFAGDLPTMVDALPSPEAASFAKAGPRASGGDLTALLEKAIGRRVSLADTATGAEFDPALYLLREDDEASYLFLCNTGEHFVAAPGVDPTKTQQHQNRTLFQHFVRDRKVGCEDLTITFHGDVHGAPVELDPESGAPAMVQPSCAVTADGCVIRTALPAIGSKLYVFPKKGSAKAAKKTAPAAPARLETLRSTKLAGPFRIRLSEANVAVLDHPAFRIADGAWQPEKEILRVDGDVRSHIGIPPRAGHMCQPWAADKPKNPRHAPVELRYTFTVEAVPSGDLFLCIEKPERFALALNGAPVSSDLDCGWWVDPSLRRIRLDASLLHPGENEITARIDYDENFSGLEIAYLLGNFGTAVHGVDHVALTPAPSELAIGDWGGQGLVFYAGHVGYDATIAPRFQKEDRVFVKLGDYRGAAVRVLVDGQEAGIAAWAPNEVDITDFLASGKPATLTLEVLGFRRNSHGALHWHEQWPAWQGHNTFVYTEGCWKDAYNLVPSGLLSAPSIEVRR